MPSAQSTPGVRSMHSRWPLVLKFSRGRLNPRPALHDLSVPHFFSALVLSPGHSPSWIILRTTSSRIMIPSLASPPWKIIA